MRISVTEGDPGYVADRSRFQDIKIFLDDVEVERCITADDEAGLIVRYKLDDKGCMIVRGDEIVTETVHGKVQIRGELLPERPSRL